MLRWGCLLCFFFAITSRLAGQGFVWTEQLGMTGSVAKVAVDASANVYVAGGYQGTARIGNVTLTNAGSWDMYLAKYASNGSLVWAKRGGGNGQDVVRDIVLDASGNIYVAGSFQLTATFDNTVLTAVGSGNNLFVAKYTPDGTLIWIKPAAGPGGGAAAYGIAVDGQGNVFTTGSDVSSSGLTSIFVQRWDSLGNLVWYREYSGQPNYYNSLSGNSVKVDGQDNTYVVGLFGPYVTIGTNTLTATGNFGEAIFIAKFDPDGNVVWAEQPDSPSITAYDTATSIALDSSTNLLIAGTYGGTINFGTNQLTTINSDNPNGFIAKADSNGNFIWARQFDQISSSGAGVAVDSGNSADVVGSVSPSQVFIKKYDANGNLLWTLAPAHTRSSNGYGVAVDTSDRPYLVSTTTGNITFDSESFTNIAGNDLFVSQISELVPPVFTTQPQSTPVGFRTGTGYAFWCVTRSVYPVSYQWSLNGSAIAGATTTAVILTNAQLSDSGAYSVVATNAYGAATSAVARLTIYFDLTTRVAGSGSVSANPPPTNGYAAGTTVTLQATSNPGFSFMAWSGDAAGTNNPLPVTVSSNLTITAQFSDAATNLVIDDSDPNALFTGSWLTASIPGVYGAGYHYVYCATPATATAVYRPTIMVRGVYNVFIWHPPAGGGSRRAPWVISCQSGTTNVQVNESTNGGSWSCIASNQYFASGTNGFVSVSNDTGESGSYYVPADAVKFLGTAPPAPQLSPPTLSGNVAQFTLSTIVGVQYTIQGSTNLTDWMPLETFTSTNATMYFQDPDSTNAVQKFYRAVVD